MLASRVQPVRVPARRARSPADLAELRTLAAKEEASREDAARQAELRQRVRERAWRAAAPGRTTTRCRSRTSRQRLADRALVAHVVTAERVVALVVTDDAGATTYDLGPRDGARRAARRAAARPRHGGGRTCPTRSPRSVRAEADQPARPARRPAAGPAAPTRSATGELVLTPSGVLAAVPWTLLPTNRGRPVIVAESATSWAARTETPLRSASAGFVAGPRVPQAEAETTAAAKVWPGSQVLHGAEATGGGGQPSWPARSTSSTSRRTAGTRRRTRCSPASSSPTVRGSATTSTSSSGCPTSCCCRRARSGARRCVVARS